ncbi:helix-turn-helix domain-containing protein [Alcanivorax sp. JB21]|uniref:helix-turn-helix domain-containing protein n=1 Tax=Alcanivorax limicola TaxID=2874102 RepID=UPI001CC00BAA|nr:helix-turn-helix transcriptional regulator [Alcanivorax limicola]MBZ2188223.1 helix-turn-helix domain-containing protein [Alcanivorax limicola]
MTQLLSLGQRLRAARKRRFPGDDLHAFAVRVGVARSTLQKMEQGDLSVALGKYHEAARILGLEEGFEHLFEAEESLFDDG